MNIGDNAEPLLTPKRQELLAKAGVTGYSPVVQAKIRQGGHTGIPCLRIYVLKKIAADALAPPDKVPSEIEGVPTDVIEVGEFDIQWRWPRSRPEILVGPSVQFIGENTGRVRPLMPGYSIGHHRITAGTAGAIGLLNGWPVVISNSHVLARSNSIQTQRASVYDPIVQPGRADGGRAGRDTVAWLAGWVPLDEAGVNRADLAWAWLGQNMRWRGGQPGIGWVAGRREAEFGLYVQKTGRSTGHTKGGYIFDPRVFMEVNFGFAKLQFEDVFMVQRMSEPGDSGSLIVTDPGNEAVGLVFAGSPQFTLGCRLKYLPPEITLVAAI
ncbi:hypothetical protein LCGC14_0692950 [marine sediment metagenome]|uniref:Peptidase S1 domain-containing protein n=1 Tax=marine sediment metagenome TaxID=412755 RepID=A0A0F9TSV5_9ZZZZ